MLRAARDGYLVYEEISGIFTTGVVVGIASGLTTTVVQVIQDPALIAEGALPGASWQLMTWADLGFACTNPESPVGGASPELDMIGEERGIGRSPGEPDALYRKRVDKLPDTVSPNAIKRAANRALAPYGIDACLREVGDIQVRFPGFFYDTPDMSGPNAYYYDPDPVAHPEERFKVYVDYLEMRAFFLITVPRGGLGEFGFGYDQGYLGFYDSFPYLSFYDGFPVTTSVLYRSVWSAVESVRAAGVSWALVPDQYGCAIA